MRSSPVIKASGLSKRFKLYRRTRDRFKELFGAKRHTDFTALKDISFELHPRQALGIIGENGSGKSTLLKLIAGILLPDAGRIERRGKITGLLELGTGFNPELSGRRNIYLNGLFLNLSRRELLEREQEIIRFAELKDFIDEPLKTYSSGMAMRLGFSIAIHANPQCFIIDEALSVGDIRFQQKCFKRLARFRQEGGSLLFVSHDLNAIKTLCDKAMLLSRGNCLYMGDPEEAVNQFNEVLAAKGESGRNPEQGYGNGDVYFTSALVLDAGGQPAKALECGRPMTVAFEWGCRRAAAGVAFGIMIRDRFGQDIFGTNGALLEATLDLSKPGSGKFTFPALNLGPGQYTINLAAHTGATHLDKCFHWWDGAASFEVLEEEPRRFSGIAKLEARLELHEKI